MSYNVYLLKQIYSIHFKGYSALLRICRRKQSLILIFIQTFAISWEKKKKKTCTNFSYDRDKHHPVIQVFPPSDNYFFDFLRFLWAFRISATCCSLLTSRMNSSKVCTLAASSSSLANSSNLLTMNSWKFWREGRLTGRDQRNCYRSLTTGKISTSI